MGRGKIKKKREDKENGEAKKKMSAVTLEANKLCLGGIFNV